MMNTKPLAYFVKDLNDRHGAPYVRPGDPGMKWSWSVRRHLFVSLATALTAAEEKNQPCPQNAVFALLGWVVKDTKPGGPHEPCYVDDGAFWVYERHVFRNKHTAHKRAGGKRRFGYPGVKVFALVRRVR